MPPTQLGLPLAAGTSVSSDSCVQSPLGQAALDIVLVTVVPGNTVGTAGLCPASCWPALSGQVDPPAWSWWLWRCSCIARPATSVWR